jgi:triacylglycerol lipase
MNIVLVHGILGFNKVLGIEYFRGIAELFEDCRVIAPQVDPTRGIEFRGTQLRDQITAAFTRGDLDSAQQTHIIAHSMGGLDSRFMLSPANPNRITLPVRSLTTISTPHQGSPIADLLTGLLNDGESLFEHLPFAAGNDPLQAALQHLNISLDGLRDLTTSRSKDFTNKFVNHPDVAYFSAAGSGRGSFLQTAAGFLLFHHHILAKTGQINDGLVTIESASFGTFDPDTWPGDHAEEVGYNLDNLAVPPSFYLEKYMRIKAKLMTL